MNRTDEPAKQPKPFGINGQREPLLPTTPPGENTASYEQGFPPITMILKSAGGLPPKGQDMNQILFELSSLGRWSSAGALNSFDNEFSTSIGGYPNGSVLLVNNSIFVSTMDGNTNDPSVTETGWKNILEYVNGAPLDSPVFTGTPKVPTANEGTNNTQAASTAFVKTSIDSSISDLALGTAAKKDVGTGTDQIPDMNSFFSSLASNGYMKFPGGLIVQWANYGPLLGNNSALISFPIPFPNQLLVAVPYTGSTAASQNLGVSIKYETRQSVTLFASTASTSTSCGAISIGY